MSASLLEELLSDFAAPGPAKAANSANRQQLRGPLAELVSCEALRISANGQPATLSTAQDSQTFATVRRPAITLEREERRGLSQVSQVSRPASAKCAEAEDLDVSAVAWTDADIVRFLDRRARLLRWQWAEPEAEALAERLVRRDREADSRVICAECQHYRPGRCGNHRQAGLHSPEVGRDLAALLQRCPGFNASNSSEAT